MKLSTLLNDCYCLVKQAIWEQQSCLDQIKCNVTDLCGHFGQPSRRGQWTQDLRGITGPEETNQLGCEQCTLFSDHKDRFLSPVVRALHPCCTPSLWGDSSGPHRFSHTHSWRLSQRNPVSFLRVSKKNSLSSIPMYLSGDTLRPVLCSCNICGQKQNNRMAPDQTTFSFKGQNNEWPHLQLLTFRSLQVLRKQTFIKGLQGSRHNFSPETDGQIQDSLVLPPLLESNCLSLMFH